MNNYVDNNTFGMEKENKKFDYNTLSGLGESDYENEELFNTEVSDNGDELDSFGIFKTHTGEEYSNGLDYKNIEFPIDYENLYDTYGFSKDTELDLTEQDYEEREHLFRKENVVADDFENENEYMDNRSFIETKKHGDFNMMDEEEPVSFIPDNLSFDEDYELLKKEKILSMKDEEFDTTVEESDDTSGTFESKPLEESAEQNTEENVRLEEDVVGFTDTLEDDSPEVLIPKETKESIPQIEESVVEETNSQNILSDTPIEELNKLTEFTEEKIETIDIKSLFDRVGVNVKEASDIFKKNTEMKEKIDSRFEQLKKLQSEVEKAKQTQYDEINSYKEEVLAKLTEKKEQIEERLNKLKEFQTSLEKEKEAFEQYRKTEKEEIERVQKEVQEAYDDRREELNHIEDVLRKQKDALDEERNQLSLDRIQYESDKNELANNLLKFNEIVDAFTNGMDKIKKE